VELKIKNVLPDDLKELMSSLEERTIVDPYMKFGAEKKKGGDWYLLSSAIAQKKRVEFQYTTKSGKTEIRKVDPLLLVFFEDHWNMIGRSHLRGEIRNFILQNMREIRILEEIVAIKNKISVEDLIFRSDSTSQKVILLVSKSEIERFRANLPAKIFKESDEKSKKIKVTFEFDNLDYINRWLLQFGEDVEIEEPEQLKIKRNELLKKMLDI